MCDSDRYVRTLILLWLHFGFWWTIAAHAEEPVPAVPRFEKVSADDPFPVKVPSAFASEKGYLVVLENRAQPQGRTLRLPVVVVRSKAKQAAESPVLYLAGGPGVSGLRAAAYPGAYPFLQDRDFVVFGQRGTQHAQPALECQEYESVIQTLNPLWSDHRKSQVLIEAANQCRTRLLAEDIDLSAYHTEASAADVEDLRIALGIEQWTLYGVSYGTRLGLAVMGAYPATVRAAVLDSPLPPQARYDDESAAHFEAALQLVFRDCDASKPCREAFPDLRNRFYQALAEADSKPLFINQQFEGRTLKVPYQGADLATLVDVSSPAAIAYAPMILDAIARGDAQGLSRLVGPGRSSGFAWGMRFSVWCSEAFPHSELSQGDPTNPILGGVASAAIAAGVCQTWRVPVRPEAVTFPVTSAVPTLLIAGEYDPLTPPVWAYEAAKTLVNSKVVVIPGGGHGLTQTWDGDGCAMSLAAQFIKQPSETVQPKAALPPCLAQQQAPEFITSIADQAK